MTEQSHPLDKHYVEIRESVDTPIGLYPHMRAAYDKGTADMLERVVEWIEANPIEDYVYTDYSGAIVYEEEFLDNFKKAMRPQEES